MIKRILITPGEPAGIGPDITLQLAQQPWAAELIVIADPELLEARAKTLKLPLKLITHDFQSPATTHQPGTLKIIPLSLIANCKAGQLNPANAAYVIKSLEMATDYCLQKLAHAIVTGPVHKGIINEAGIAFTGHTEFLAIRCGIARSVMLFVTPQTKVALATTHLALSQVPSAITAGLLSSTLHIMHNELQTKFNIQQPNIAVCGLNPHAGEQGHMGREEIDIIEPVLNELRKKGLRLTGPLPADTIFTEKHLASTDAILAMYHDQALPVVKYMGFSNAINVTLGLPIIRTSVDHGTALDIAGTGTADPGSLAAAVNLAISLKQ